MSCEGTPQPHSAQDDLQVFTHIIRLGTRRDDQSNIVPVSYPAMSVELLVYWEHHGITHHRAYGCSRGYSADSLYGLAGVVSAGVGEIAS